MALNVIFSDTRAERRAVPVGNDVAPGTPLIQGTRPAVTLTGSRDYAGNAVTVSGRSAGGVPTSLVIAGGRGGESLPADDYATVTYTGTYAFPVEGATLAAALPGTPVYIDEATNELSITDTAGTKFGVVEFYRGSDSATDTAVTIGVNLG
ncbi:hypothetical protein SEA_NECROPHOXINUS_44 [Microbacterium phage Necrophoxinus]|nr:hypothetical protein SEA_NECROPHOXINUS_44 [Microbacterium phage Necrophoxinus]QYC54161.1 hypothetical protein SEA_WELCOME_43 [Microbacterium phage Welcome]URM87445.1 hypothetical protein SEA_DUSTYDINO_45 [Microbacterium phage DustyDino]UVK62456.1 hypothetical protein SEA_YUMA_41 [Microbacterium phage Yuma]WMI33913.1 hypothetical protein SEA_ERENYEAGER_42 [Microbacterium phage Erenyeager]WNO25933.1 hypothetical protein SEA_ASEGATO_41 [Microbacterium phage ASegato]